MHRLAAVPGSSSPGDGVLFIEQPPVTTVLLTSADSDLAALAGVLDRQPQLTGGRRLTDRDAQRTEQHHITGRGDRLRHIGEAFLRAERGNDLRIGIEF